MQIAGVVEGLYLLQVGQRMDWANVVQDDVEDEAHPGLHMGDFDPKGM